MVCVEQFLHQVIDLVFIQHLLIIELDGAGELREVSEYRCVIEIELTGFISGELVGQIVLEPVKFFPRIPDYYALSLEELQHIADEGLFLDIPDLSERSVISKSVEFAMSHNQSCVVQNVTVCILGY